MDRTFAGRRYKNSKGLLIHNQAKTTNKIIKEEREKQSKKVEQFENEVIDFCEKNPIKCEDCIFWNGDKGDRVCKIMAIKDKVFGVKNENEKL